MASVTEALTFKPLGWPTMVQFRAVDAYNAFILSQQHYHYKIQHIPIPLHNIDHLICLKLMFKRFQSEWLNTM